MQRRNAKLDLYAVRGEPATWRTFEKPSHDGSLTAIVSANLVLPALPLAKWSAG